MHRIALGLVFVAATAQADRFVDAPDRAVGLAFVAHADHIGSATASGVGANVEGALGVDHAQYFAELALTSASIEKMDINGYFGRAGLGARWLARQMQFDRGGGVEMYLEAVTGVERIWWQGGGQLTRPDVGVGIGLQIRGWELHGATIRLGSRIMFAPTDRESSLVACRGVGCPVGTSTSVAGFATTIGVAW